MSKRWFVVDWDCCLGAGGEGEVYLGRSLETFELCAIKVSTLIDRDAAADQLKTELDRLLRVAGEGVVGLVAWNLDAAKPFLVFEFARAGTLADEMMELRSQGRVYHPKRAVERIRGVFVALANVHARGLLHRDVKPANLLRFGASLKLGDFGAGRSVPSTDYAGTPRTSGASPLETQGFVGTRLYASPEQLLGEQGDERSDLYAAGCILVEMLSGKVPVSGRRRQFYPHTLVLPELDSLVSSLLAPEPALRPSSATDAVGRVDTVLEAYRTARRLWQDLQLGPSPY